MTPNDGEQSPSFGLVVVTLAGVAMWWYVIVFTVGHGGWLFGMVL
jgi:hypothetical protein